MTDTPQPKRGGKREPLPRLTILIPNFRKYQRATKGRREWLRVQTGIGRSKQVRDACAITRNVNPLAVFLALLGLADNAGAVVGCSAKDIAFETPGLDPRTVTASLQALEKVGLIMQGACNEQTTSMQRACNEHATSMQPPHEEVSQDAVQTPTTIDNRQSTVETEKTTSVEGEPAGVFSQPPATVEPAGKTVTAADLIEQALASAHVPHRGADPILFYRSEAVGFMTRRPGDMRNEQWASWVCEAIAAVGACDDWLVRVNAALKKSATVGSFIPPEAPNHKPQRGGRRQVSDADRAYFASLNDEFGTVPSHG